MQVRCYESPQEFGDDVLPWLLPEEARNHLMISLILGLVEKGWQNQYAAPPVMAAVRDDRGQIEAVTLRTPPHNALISSGSIPAIRELSRWYAQRNEQLPGVLGPSEDSRLFAASWANKTSSGYQVRTELIAHQLTKVLAPRGVPGRMRYAELSDRGTLVDWAAGFQRETGITHKPPPEVIMESYIHDRSTCVWDVDGEITSMVIIIRGTPSGMRIGGVYTPKDQRGRRYASALVAAASRHILDQGKSHCFLYTDAANPTSNYIYRMIGYEPVGAFTEYQFQ